MKKVSVGKHVVVLILAVFWIIMFALNGNFRMGDNLASILREASSTGIAALGMTFIIIMGDFDLSIGSMLAFLGIVMAGTMNSVGMGPSLILVCIAGVICGLLNGVIVSYFNVPAFITTLGTYYSFRALAYILNNANTIMCTKPSFLQIGNGSIGIIPIPFIMLLVLAVTGAVILNRTVYGRNVRALGNSMEACRISGINTKRVKTLAFMLMGFCTAAATMIVTARQACASPDVATNFHFDAITVVVLGGTKLTGGEGSIFNTVIAAILYASVANCLNLYHVDAKWQRICMGIILLLAFSFDFIQRTVSRLRENSQKKTAQSA
ncbi:ABC transporter permease [Ruminococcus sp. OA3]|uniref:ABC transporter permease n=1 Tax=Ruminococcus sp. OA3 TaxID=2914164 RepID=UPI001F065A28|nr:ABC transporter permease [Ruminococcus sp. OA3]MCH1982880.1 ABC transporter permease [Ruminococcus sp. OA3]